MTFAFVLGVEEAAADVEAPEYREPPVQGSPREVEGGIADDGAVCGARYLEAPVNGSM